MYVCYEHPNRYVKNIDKKIRRSTVVGPFYSVESLESTPFVVDLLFYYIK